jgi:glycosyltransferase involved in cell wall biosynthesis
VLLASTGARVGVATIVSGLARGLARRGFHVTVLCCMEEAALAEELGRHAIAVELHAVRWIFDPGAVAALAGRLRRDRVDLIHTHGQRAMMAGNLAARLAGVPAVVTSFHEHAWVKSTIRRGRYLLYAAVEGWLARHFTDACIATCRSVLEDAVLVRGVPRAKLSLTYNAADVSRFRALDDAPERERRRAALRLSAGDFVIGCVAALMPVKAHEDLISALALVRSEIPSARLLLAGSGPRRAALERHAAREGVAADVVFAGDAPEPERVFSTLDVFAMSSLSEVCPLALLEAFACRVPVVATSVGGIPELVRADVDGVLVPARDPRAMADAILRIARDPELGRRLADSAAERGRRTFSEASFIDGHVDLYRRVLKSRGVTILDDA